MERSSFLTTVLIVVAFTLGVLGSNLFRSVFGLLSRMNHRKSLTENTNKQTEKLPDLPPTVRLSIMYSVQLTDSIFDLQFKMLVDCYH